GFVLDASGGVPGLTVTVRALAPGFEQTRGVMTGGAGEYQLENVYVGPVTASAGSTSPPRYGENAGTLAHHGGDLQLDISLTANATTLPRSLFDANNAVFDVQADGHLGTGLLGLFNGSGTERGAFLLDVVREGVATRVEGGEVPTLEDGGREIAVRQEGVA